VVGVPRSKVALVLDVEPFSLDVDRAILCGLALNELIHNSLKHAFPDERTGHVRVQLRRDGDSIFMAVGDDGIGVSTLEHGDHAKRVSLGMQLVQMLVTQLRGELTVRSGQGTEFQVRFPALVR
jgi:two-component sensor histidine kinase